MNPSAKCPQSVRPDNPRTSGRNPSGVRNMSALPDPTRPDPTRKSGYVPAQTSPNAVLTSNGYEGIASHVTTAVATDAMPDDDDHIVCCRDHDLAICGLDVTGHTWAPDDATPDNICARCDELEAGLDDDPTDEPCLTPCPALRARDAIDAILGGRR